MIGLARVGGQYNQGRFIAMESYFMGLSSEARLQCMSGGREVFDVSARALATCAYFRMPTHGRTFGCAS